MLDKGEVASAYVDFMRGDIEPLLALVHDEFVDNVSGQRGPGIWRVVADWLSTSFDELAVEVHSVANDDEGRVLVWITLHGTHIGSAFPFMADRPPSGRRVAWKQVHVFRIDGDQVVEHWAVRDDLRVLEAIDAE